MRAQPWSEAENLAAVAAYNGMMADDGNGHDYSKARVIRALRGVPKENEPAAVSLMIFGALAGRSRGSIEFKFGNISAARDSLCLPLLKGYKAAGNYQQSLRELIKVQTRVHTIPATEDNR
jgi:5-methylcytosine-specific restriction protein A